MSIQDFIRILRARWITVCVTTAIATLGALFYTLAQTPLYEASTRLFVSTGSSSSVTELYSGNRLSQERVLSYTQLIMGETLAQRTIDRLGLDMSPATVKAKVTAKSKTGTVLIDVSVLDASPVLARDIANSLSDQFVIMARELETPSTGAVPEARVVVEQRASMPEKPVVPKKRRDIGLGFIVGASLGIGFALLRDQLDNTIKNQKDLENVTDTSIVGYIPFDKEMVAQPAINFDTSRSVVAEAFRKLRTNLQFLAVDDPPRLIVITSSSPSEGKSTASINIALALAEAEQNVVLVDGDLRRPRLAQYLNLVGSAGFSTVLANQASLDEVLQDTKHPGLTVLAAGAIPPNPSELLGSYAAKKLLAELRGRFDYVIIDSSPLLAVTDGAVLAAEADGTLIIARAGKTKRDQLAHAVGMLHDVGAKVIGAVFTMIPTRGSDSYSYSNYSYGDYGDKRSRLNYSGPIQHPASPPKKPASESSTDRGGASARGTAQTGSDE